MRVVSGSARGTKLRTLSGSDVIRPTTDRVKESLFNIIQFNVPDSSVLDIFCGSGALGIEALSRGADFCDFVDINKDSLKCTEDNLRTTHLEERSSVHKTDFESFLYSCRKKFDLIFADPPYASDFFERLAYGICKNKLLTDDGIFIFETSSDNEFDTPPQLEAYRTAVYGNTKIVFFKYKENLN